MNAATVRPERRQVDTEAARLRLRVVQLQGVLEEALEVLEDYSDVRDGPDGQPQANAAMALAQLIVSTLAERPRPTEEDTCDFCGGPLGGVAGSHARCLQSEVDRENGEDGR